MSTPSQSKIFADSKPLMGDFAHAAAVFRTNNLELAPKTKFLYHVNFNFNPPAIAALGIKKELLSVLVKTAELPKFNIQTDTLNQYNRKKITQVKVDYQPVQIKFHDDNNNVVQDLWEYYFAYHYADSTTAKFDPIRYLAYTRNAMDDAGGRPAGVYRFGYDTGNQFRFFNSIEIFQMSRGEWSRYVLVNPVILSWNHDSLDYSSSQPAEQTMTVGYEAVGYSNGSGNPDGFPTSKYDTVKSPTGLTNSGTFTQGVSAERSATSFATAEPIPTNTAVQQVNSYQNVNTNLPTGIATVGITTTISSAITNLNEPTVTGGVPVAFNIQESQPTTQAIQSNL
jgi:hypothetical protein